MNSLLLFAGILPCETTYLLNFLALVAGIWLAGLFVLASTLEPHKKWHKMSVRAVQLLIILAGIGLIGITIYDVTRTSEVCRAERPGAMTYIIAQWPVLFACTGGLIYVVRKNRLFGIVIRTILGFVYVISIPIVLYLVVTGVISR